MPTLRDRQRQVARQSIVDACAELVTERHQLDFTMKEVADRSGVSLRTVYNHFETREDLLDELGAEFDRRTAALDGPTAAGLEELGDLRTAIVRNGAIFEELGGISEAFAQMPLEDIGRDEQRTIRTAALVDFLVGCMPEVERADADPIALLIRHMFSHRSWFWLTREYGLSSDDYAALTIWATETLLEAARRGDLPTRKEPT